MSDQAVKRKTFREEREEADAALDAYMEMMSRAHKETCGHGVVTHGTTWCARESEGWADGLEYNDQQWPGWHQFQFIRDDILFTLGKAVGYAMYPTGAKYEDQVGASVPDVVVVGTHTSKSLRLPVMQFKWRDMLVTCRNNFHDWKVSVQMPLGLDPTEDLLDIAATDDHLLHPVYFEGFPKEYIYRPLAAGDFALTGQFSTMFGSSNVGYHRMWTFFWLLKRWYEGRFGPLET